MQDKGDRNGVINHFVQFLQGHTYRRRQRQSHFFCKERGHAVLELNLCGSEQKSEEREKSFCFLWPKCHETHTHTWQMLLLTDVVDVLSYIHFSHGFH